MLNKKVVLALIVFVCMSVYSVEFFKGYSSSNIPSIYSITALLKPKYNSESKFNENYFHEAQFPEQGITVFTNVIFSKGIFGKKGCKLNCIITFNENEKYIFNKDYDQKEFNIQNGGFGINFGENFIELKQNNYSIHIKDENIKLNLTYSISAPPHIFGDGAIHIDNASLLAFSQPVIGSFVTGSLEYKDKNLKLKGRGSVGHDYNSIMPINNPRKWRSFWLYNDKYSINIDTLILTNKMQIDRVVITKDGNYFESFLNCGLTSAKYVMDNENNFKYPTEFTINHTDKEGNNIKAYIKLRSFTDKIQIFKNLSEGIYAIVKKAVGEMWAYRFWSDGEFILRSTNGTEEFIKISGVGNFVDLDRSTNKE